ncbi:hypothetical protein [Nitrincola iocasae]|uniref:Uncharacterized protein n=1 Tax=Nitrincola iocasae TaxID=2614693 RepID=A0A5J6LBF1_9GAMM|nr:hypothetical protein [Nitrincola iocasae]QEW05736.1 hypothetical protein F5I99_04110 [Nitrincola iocasae]
MQDKYTISDLPVDIMLPGLNGKSRFYTVLGWLQVLLLIVCVIEVLVIMFGPDEIMVDKRIGVTFVQFFLIYPGPIVTACFIIMSILQLAQSQRAEKLMKQFNESLHSQLEIIDDEIPEGKELELLPLLSPKEQSEFQLFRIQLVDVSEKQLNH